MLYLLVLFPFGIVLLALLAGLPLGGYRNLVMIGVGDVEEKRALELALVKAQKQSEELPVACQFEITKEFIARAEKRILVADKKIRLAQVARRQGREGVRCARQFLWQRHVSNAS